MSGHRSSSVQIFDTAPQSIFEVRMKRDIKPKISLSASSVFERANALSDVVPSFTLRIANRYCSS